MSNFKPALEILINSHLNESDFPHCLEDMIGEITSKHYSLLVKLCAINHVYGNFTQDRIKTGLMQDIKHFTDTVWQNYDQDFIRECGKLRERLKNE